MKYRKTCCLFLVAYLCIPNFAVSQEIKATSIGKMPPARTQTGGIQIDIYNQTRSEQQLEIREPGGNWYQFTIPVRTGVNLRCETKADHFEASLPGSAVSSQPLTPGIIYDMISNQTGQLSIAQRRG